MSTSRARFRRWTQASALLAVLCAGVVLLLGGSDTSAWDDANTDKLHDNGSHAGGGNGWLIDPNKHDITSNKEGPVGRKGCRSLLDPKVNNKNRGPTSVPTSSITIVPVTIVVELGVNFRARNCIDFYRCDDEDWEYVVSTWDEDHRHGNSDAGFNFDHQSTYTIILFAQPATNWSSVKITDDVDARLTAACGGTTTTPGTPPERCPPGSTFEGRLVSELTYDANGDGRIDKHDCSATVPPPTTVPPTPTTTPTQTPPCPSSERTGETVPPDEVKDENGDWLTGDALAAAIEEWRCREPVPPKDVSAGWSTGEPGGCGGAGSLKEATEPASQRPTNPTDQPASRAASRARRAAPS